MKIKNDRRSIRLPDYDYSQYGMYFIIICSHESKYIFGHIDNGIMYLNNVGRAVEGAWRKIPYHFPHVELDAFVIMPNHIHGIINIVSSVKSDIDNHGMQNGTSKSIGSIVRGFKIMVTRWAKVNTKIQDVWQRNYYEHVIRDDEDYYLIADYIETNPVRWVKDKLYQG